MGSWGAQERERRAAELAKLPSQREAAQAEAQLSGELAGLEREVHFKSAELKGRASFPWCMHSSLRAAAAPFPTNLDSQRVGL